MRKALLSTAAVTLAIGMSFGVANAYNQNGATVSIGGGVNAKSGATVTLQSDGNGSAAIVAGNQSVAYVGLTGTGVKATTSSVSGGFAKTTGDAWTIGGATGKATAGVGGFATFGNFDH